MTQIYKSITKTLKSAALVLTIATPAAAIDLGGVSVGGNDKGGVSVSVGGVSASVGTNNGVSADVGADLGSTSANVDASVGGGSLAEANADANVGNAVSARSNTTVGGGRGSLLDSNTTASVGGNKGLNAEVDINAGKRGLGALLGFGRRPKDDPGTGGPGTGGPGNGNGGGLFGGGNGGGKNAAERAIEGLSDKQIAIYRNRCGGILRNPAAWDYGLVQMCKSLTQASSR